MHRLLAPAALGLVLLAPALAHADVPPPGCRRCSVEDDAGGGLAALVIAGLAGLALRQRGRGERNRL